MNSPTRLLLLCAICVFSTGCATMANGSRQSVTVNSTPNRAQVFVNGAEVGVTPWTGQVARAKSTTLEIKKEGHEPQTILLNGRYSPEFWFSVVISFFTPLTCLSTTDLAGGSCYEYDTDMFAVTLPPSATAVEAPVR
jgi:hypothetical protein